MWQGSSFFVLPRKRNVSWFLPLAETKEQGVLSLPPIWIMKDVG